MKKYIILIILSGILTFLLRHSIETFQYSIYKDTLDALMNISSIIFAIIGAWIAIIYPKAIGVVFKPTSSEKEIKESDADTNYLSELVEIVMVSAIVLMFVLLLKFGVPLASKILPQEYINYGRYIAFFFISTLTFSQLHAIFRVILANYFFLNQLRNKNISSKVERLHK